MGRLMETAAVSSSGAGVHTQEANCADLALVSKSLESLVRSGIVVRPDTIVDSFMLLRILGTMWLIAWPLVLGGLCSCVGIMMYFIQQCTTPNACRWFCPSAPRYTRLMCRL